MDLPMLSAPFAASMSDANENEPVTRLNNDLLFEIFLRLPAELLHQKFKFICKQWYNIITSPIFINIHQHEVGILHKVISKNRDVTFRFMEFKGLETGNSRELMKFPKKISLYSVTNGLMLCRDNVSKEVFVANPITKETLVIPTSEQRKCDQKGWEFVYVPSTKKFKVIEVVRYAGQKIYEVYVRTLGDSVSEPLIAIPGVKLLERYLVYMCNEQAVVDGILYMYFPNDSNFEGSMGYIDVKCETKATAGSLRCPMTISCLSCLTVMDGMLAIIQHTMDDEFEFWVLKNINAEEWDCKLRISISHDIHGKVGYSKFRILTSFSNGEVLCFQRSITIPEYVLFYVNIRQWKEITHEVGVDLYSSLFYECNHINNLLQPKTVI